MRNIEMAQGPPGRDTNTGIGNAGDCNSGNKNRGSGNAGDCNTGSGNSGDWNVVDGSSGCFNTEPTTLLMFNRPSRWTLKDWMESEARSLIIGAPFNAEYRQKWWDSLYPEERKTVMELPNFNAAVFEKCTGIRIRIGTYEEGTCGDAFWTLKENVLNIFVKERHGYIRPSHKPGNWPWTKFRENITEIHVGAGVRAKTLDHIFSGMRKCQVFDVENLDTSEAVSMRCAFEDCRQLNDRSSGALARWDLSAVQDMSGMFKDCTSLIFPPISGWDTRNLANARFMFMNTGVKDLKFLWHWAVGEKAKIDGMFYGCIDLQTTDGLEHFSLGKDTSADYAFAYCISLKNISSVLGFLFTVMTECDGICEGTAFDRTSFPSIAAFQDDYFEFLNEFIMPEDARDLGMIEARKKGMVSAYELLHGYCNIFAKALHEETGFPTYQVRTTYGLEGKEEQFLIHCYCVEETGHGPVYIDVRGRYTDYRKFMSEFEDWIDIDEAYDTAYPYDTGSLDTGINAETDNAYRLSKKMLRKFKEQYME